jgi:hypothetical protein
MNLDTKLLNNLKRILQENNQSEDLSKLMIILLEKLDSGEDFDSNQIIQEIIEKTNG